LLIVAAADMKISTYSMSVQYWQHTIWWWWSACKLQLTGWYMYWNAPLV